MVQQFLLDLLVSPRTQRPLSLRTSVAGSSRLIGSEGEEYPVRNSIPRFVEDQEFVESFGYQWNRFDVRQIGEDEETFVLKTGVALDELEGKTVLDAGCGGGRYSRVAADHGATVVGVDRSDAVEKARQLTAEVSNAAFVQCDLTALPFQPESFDLVFSIGVLHHSPDTWEAFRSVARMVRPGGRLSVWLYRRNWWFQERINDALRWAARRVPRGALMRCCEAAAVLGGAPVLNRSLNKIANFSNHPRWENRVCDNFDWYSPEFQHHHTLNEAVQKFAECGFHEIRELLPAKKGTLYRRAFLAGLIIGSGVNVTATKKDAGRA